LRSRAGWSGMIEADALTTIAVAGGAVLAALILQALLNKVDKAVRHHPGVRALVRQGYREIIVIGIITAVLFILTSKSTSLPEAVLTSLDKVHNATIAFVVTYLLALGGLLALSHIVSWSWSSIEAQAHDFAAYRALRRSLAGHARELGVEIDTSSKRPSTAQLCRRPWTALRYASELRKARLLEQRYRFIRRNRLPRDFSFAGYLQLCMTETLVRTAAVPAELWACALMLIGVDAYLRSLWPWYNDKVDGAVVIVALAIAGTSAALICFLKISRISWALFHSEFAQLLLSPAAVEAATEWDAILPAGSGFGMSMRVRVRGTGPDMDVPRRPRTPPSPAGSATVVQPGEHGDAGSDAGASLVPSPASSLRVLMAQAAEEEERGVPAASWPAGEAQGGETAIDADVDSVALPGTRGLRGLQQLPLLEGVPVEEASDFAAQPLSPTELARRATHLHQQRALFWLGSPLLLVRIMQAVLFGFAATISLLSLRGQRRRATPRALSPPSSPSASGSSLARICCPPSYLPMYCACT